VATKQHETKVVENWAGRIPPQSLEAEQSVLGSLILDRDAIIKIADILSTEDFYEEKHRIIYSAIIRLYDERASIDILTVSNKLEEGASLEKIGGASYLSTLVNVVPSSAHIVHYANIVRRKGTLRRLDLPSHRYSFARLPRRHRSGNPARLGRTETFFSFAEIFKAKFRCSFRNFARDV
jgi:hypothetical protein